jgi:hypothetical protein
MFLCQLDERVGEKIPTSKKKKTVNVLDKMLKVEGDEEMSDYEIIRMRNIRQRLEMFQQVFFFFLTDDNHFVVKNEYGWIVAGRLYSMGYIV